VSRGLPRERAAKRWAVARRLVQRGFAGQLGRAVAVRFYSRTISLGLRRDLEVPHVTPLPRVEVAIRRLREGDDLSFLDPTPDTSGREAVFAAGLRELARREPGTAWVALGRDGVPCYIQWLFCGDELAIARQEWGDLLPLLAPGEALMEGAYLSARARGNGIMAYAIDHVARAARERGARWVLGFVHHDNFPSLKSGERAGLRPYVERLEAWRLFRRRVAFRFLAPSAPHPFARTSASAA
jgi:GNAT superfamily N-acetyltransferase